MIIYSERKHCDKLCKSSKTNKISNIGEKLSYFKNLILCAENLLLQIYNNELYFLFPMSTTIFNALNSKYSNYSLQRLLAERKK